MGEVEKRYVVGLWWRRKKEGEKMVRGWVGVEKGKRGEQRGSA